MEALARKAGVDSAVFRLAEQIWSTFLDSTPGALRGRTDKDVQHMLAYCLYHAGMHLGQGMEITMDELVIAISTDSNLSSLERQKGKSSIHNAGKKCIKQFLPIADNDQNDRESKYSQAVRAFIQKLCRELNFDPNEKTTAEDMANEIVRKSLHSRRGPASTAGVIVWICSLLHGRQIDVHMLAKFSVQRKTLMKMYKELESHLNDMVTLNKFGNWNEIVTKLRAP